MGFSGLKISGHSGTQFKHRKVFKHIKKYQQVYKYDFKYSNETLDSGLSLIHI